MIDVRSLRPVLTLRARQSVATLADTTGKVVVELLLHDRMQAETGEPLLAGCAVESR